jgi:hypothetical protein
MTITAGLLQSPAQAAVVALLKADATLTGMIANVYDDVPNGTTKDFIAMGDWSEGSDDTLEDDNAGIGSECRLTIHVLTDDQAPNAGTVSKGFKKGQSVASRIKVLLHGQPLTIEGWTHVMTEHESTIAFRDEDEQGRPKRHQVSTYRIVAEAT